MKKYKMMSLLLAAMAFAACNEDSIAPLEGDYDMDRYVFTTASQSPTVKLKKGVKALNMTLSDGSNSAAVSFGSSEWVLQAGSFTPTTDVTLNGDYSLTLNGQRVAASGSLDVTQVGETYYINGLLSDASGTRFSVNYKGALSFEIGVDDPEASGYTVAVSEGVVTDASGVVCEGLTKYAIKVSDPDGAEVAEFDMVGKSGSSLADLAGDHTAQSYPTEEGLMDAGWVAYYPDWGIEMAGGTYYTDSDGVKQYISAGSVTLTVQQDVDGVPLYSFSGEGLSTLTAQNVAGADGSFKILYATLSETTE